MASLKSIAEQAFNTVFPSPGDETSITKQQFLATAKLQFAYQNLLLYWRRKREGEEYIIPSSLLTQESLDVLNDEVDISKLKVFRAFGADTYIRNIGGLTCECNYVKTNENQVQLFCDDDSLSVLDRTYLILGNKIVFPKGVHASPLPIIYVNSGENISGDIEVEESVGALVLEKLIEIFSKKGVEDVTNNSSSVT